MENKKVNFVILPPDGFHHTFDDLLYESQSRFTKIVDMIAELSNNQSYLVKYRTSHQRENYLCNHPYLINEKLSDYCDENTKFIGPVASSTIEQLIKGIKYFSYDLFKAYRYNRMIYNDYNQVIHISNNIEELKYNIINNQIYKKGLSKNDLINTNGQSLRDIVNSILSEK